MNEFKGTQKDWKEVGHNDNGIFIGGEDSSGAICHVYYQNKGVSAGEGRANARLIANAKRLMNFAQDFIDLIEKGTPMGGDCFVTAKQVLNDINKDEP